jgi:ankyrin repeat protein
MIHKPFLIYPIFAIIIFCINTGLAMGRYDCIETLNATERSDYIKTINDLLTGAISYNDIEGVQKLLENPALDINFMDHHGHFPLKEACWSNTIIVELLLDKGANINLANEDGWTPLICAASINRVDVIKILLSNGADINLKNKDGKTARDIAQKLGHTKIVAAIDQAIMERI